MTTPFRLNPQRIAYYEANGWRAYYDRRWLKLLRLIVALCQEEFRIPFPQSLLAAYYTTRASIAWVPIDHDVNTVRAYLEKFYRVARRYSGLHFDPAHVAALELHYFDVHRRFVEVEDKSAVLDAFINLHSALFGLTPEEVRTSAEYRLRAANTVDLITSKKSTDIEADWASLERDLCECYASIQQHLDQHASQHTDG